jgi:hypothetical protein
MKGFLRGIDTTVGREPIKPVYIKKFLKLIDEIKEQANESKSPGGQPGAGCETADFPFDLRDG